MPVPKFGNWLTSAPLPLDCLKMYFKIPKSMRLPVSTPRLRLFSVANFRKYLWYCRLYGLKNATKLAFRRLEKPNTTLRRAYKVSDDSK
jgi:hypothetical protein